MNSNFLDCWDSSLRITGASITRRGTRGRLRELPFPLFLPFHPLSTRGRGGARHEAHPAPPRCFFSRRGGTVADATVDHQHLFLELRLPLLLLLRLLRLLNPTSVPPPPHLFGAAGETAPGGTAQPRRPECRHHPEPAVRGGAPAPGLLLSPWGGTVVPLGQEHCDGHPLSHERSRRCRLRAAAVAVSTPALVNIIKAQLKSHQHKTEQPV